MFGFSGMFFLTSLKLLWGEQVTVTYIVGCPDLNLASREYLEDGLPGRR